MRLTTALVLVLLSTVGRAAAQDAERLTGHGSTLGTAPMEHWSQAYAKKRKIEIDFATVGTGACINQLVLQEVDFCCIDRPLSAKELKWANDNNGDVIQFPVALEAVVPIYNLPGLEGKTLRLTGEVLADIYLGKITKWNDPALQQLQENGVKLPDLEITVVYRADFSFATYHWTEYLALKSEEWKKTAQIGTNIQWPTGIGQKGNDGVAAQVKNTQGSIGYVDLTTASHHKLVTAAVRNKDGRFVRADLKAVTEAARALAKELAEDVRYSLLDAPGARSYPICTRLVVVAYAKQPAGKARALRDFLTWTLHDGQGMLENLGYAPLPPEVVTAAEKQVRKIGN
jgi:phosphate transport system substrate-binding protein